MIRSSIKSTQSYFAAEAGIEDSIYRIIKGKKYEAINSFEVGDGQVNISISSEGNSKVIESSGIVSSNVRKLKTFLNPETSTVTFHYGAQVDQWGLEIQPNAQVSGNVYSNGRIQGGGSTSKITGDAWIAGGVEPNPDQNWTIQNSDFAFGIKVGPTYYLDTAQSFVPSESKIINRVSLYLKKVGSPPDQTVKILTDNNGKPSQTSLTSGTLKSSKVTANYSWVDISFDPPSTLTASQTYWVMIDASQDNNNYWIWGKDNTDNYAFGTGKYTKDWTDSEATWSNVNGDLDFKTWMGGIVTYIDNAWIGVDVHANTITNSNIGRDAYYLQNIENTIVSGSACPNSHCHPNTPDPATKDLPISYAQIQDWESAAKDGGGEITCPYSDAKIVCALEQGVCVCKPVKDSTLGPKKINGNLTFPDNSLENPVTITGVVWVTGDILAENKAKIILKTDSTAGYPIIADNPIDQANAGRIEFDNNVITEDSSQGGRLLFISTNSSLDSSNPAIWLYNNVNKDTAQSIIFSLQGLIKVENNVKFKEITGYGLYLANNAEIVYEEGLINSNFSSGPGASWKIKNWGEIE